MKEMIVALVAKVGIQAAIDLLENLANVKTIDDAITALKASAAKNWQNYKDEAAPPPS